MQDFLQQLYAHMPSLAIDGLKEHSKKKLLNILSGFISMLSSLKDYIVSSVDNDVTLYVSKEELFGNAVVVFIAFLYLCLFFQYGFKRISLFSFPVCVLFLYLLVSYFENGILVNITAFTLFLDKYPPVKSLCLEFDLHLILLSFGLCLVLFSLHSALKKGVLLFTLVYACSLYSGFLTSFNHLLVIVLASCIVFCALLKVSSIFEKIILFILTSLACSTLAMCFGSLFVSDVMITFNGVLFDGNFEILYKSTAGVTWFLIFSLALFSPVMDS